MTSVALALFLLFSQGHPAKAGVRKTLHTAFFVYLEKGGWAEENLPLVEMGSKAGWACKASAIETSELGTLGEGKTVFKSATVYCRAENGAKIEMLPSCDLGYPNRGGGSVRLYSKDGDFAVMTAQCKTYYK
jgi:hypothetical protein